MGKRNRGFTRQKYEKWLKEGRGKGTVKPYDMVNDGRQIEKFEIERRYWKTRGIDWGIITDNKINRILASNIDNIYHSFDLDGTDGLENISKVQIEKLVNAYKNLILGKDVIIREKANLFDEKMALKNGVGILLFKHLLITKQIAVDSFFTTYLNNIVDTPQNICSRTSLKNIPVGELI